MHTSHQIKETPHASFQIFHLYLHLSQKWNYRKVSTVWVDGLPEPFVTGVCFPRATKCGPFSSPAHVLADHQSWGWVFLLLLSCLLEIFTHRQSSIICKSKGCGGRQPAWTPARCLWSLSPLTGDLPLEASFSSSKSGNSNTRLVRLCDDDMREST